MKNSIGMEMKNKELDNILKRHCDWFFGEENGEKANLRSEDLHQFNLCEVNLPYADLNDINLAEANLSNANLNGANLNGSNLSGANLIKADLSDSNLSAANLSYANLRHADLQGADLRGANLFRAKLSDTNLNQIRLQNTNLCEAILPKKTYYIQLDKFYIFIHEGQIQINGQIHTIDQKGGLVNQSEEVGVDNVDLSQIPLELFKVITLLIG